MEITPLIQRNIDKFEQQLPERWNTDGTRKFFSGSILYTKTYPTMTTPETHQERMAEMSQEMRVGGIPIVFDEDVPADCVGIFVDFGNYSQPDPDVAKLKYGEVDFCDQ